MIEKLFTLSQHFINVQNKKYHRYFIKKNPLNIRFAIITGQRGVGKTTGIIQYIASSYKRFSKKAVYIPADHFLVGKLSLYEISEEFVQLGGELICFDEIHKYPEWSTELKSIYDTFPELKIIASGSSILKIHQGTHDLSRRAVVFNMRGMSFREFIEINLNIELRTEALEDILEDHEEIAAEIIKRVEEANSKILLLFKDYLKYGYYPYFNEYKDINLFYITLEQNIHTSIESDLMSVYPKLKGQPELVW